MNFLVPGFVATFLFYYPLTSFPKKSAFEMIVMALICTTFINIITVPWYWLVGMAKARWVSFAWLELFGREAWSFLFSVPIGLLLAYWQNNDSLYKLFRKFKITQKSSYPSEWYGTFTETVFYVVLHLNDGRRIMGWPREWPTHPKNGHFVLEDASWLKKSKETPLDRVTKILIDAANVSMVEFLKPSPQGD